ncbi:MAG: cysteine--tRNA ligase [Candidatus Geothermincolia bacterium]
MKLKVYNTLAGGKQEFEPREPGKVYMYVCGPTVYNYIHIGNARAYLAFDVIKRYLEFSGYQVFHAQNITDVDDKIINRAAEEGVAPQELAETYTEAFHEDMAALHVLPPDIEPRATEHIAQMISMIEGLVERGHAYAAGGDVFYAVESFSGYGKLSRRSLEEMRAGERIDIDKRKRHPMDFALWKAAKPGEPAWDSPWGPGRPGWHIECSAMSLEYLEAGFDIHGGGRDLVFPHHENEIAQSEGYTETEPFVRFWLHNGFVNIDKEKMSKSLGNIVLIRDILEHYEGDVVRLLTLMTQYRNPIDFGADALEESKRALNRLQECLFNARDFLDKRVGKSASPVRTQREVTLSDSIFNAQRRFTEAMDDDFNTARAMAVIYDLVKELNTYLAEQGVYETPAAVAVMQQGYEMLQKLARVLGLLQGTEGEEGAARASGGESEAASAASVQADALVDLLVRVRDEARARKEWETSDLIRAELEGMGIRIEDRRDGTRWRRA